MAGAGILCQPSGNFFCSPGAIRKRNKSLSGHELAEMLGDPTILFLLWIKESVTALSG
jgi:hypothetical protein